MSHTEQEPACNQTSFDTRSERGSVLRVFAIFFHPNSFVTAMGGAERRFVEVLRFFSRKSDLRLAVLESAPSLLEQANLTFERHSLPSVFHGRGWLSSYVGWLLWAVRASVKSVFLTRQARPDVMLVSNNTPPNLLTGYAASLILRVPLCVVTHHIDTSFYGHGGKDGSLYGCYRSIRFGRLVSLAKTLASHATILLLKKARGVIAVSNSTVQVLRDKGVTAPKMIVSGNAVSPDLAENSELWSGEKTYDGVFVGRISKEKGVFDLLRMWKEVVKVRKEAKLLLVGSGLELSQIKRRIIAVGLENRVLLRGACEDTELYCLLRRSRVFVFPSVFEGWGMAVAEALSCGLPVVAYDIPALKEVFGECESVFLVPTKNVENMTSTVLDILDAGEEKLHNLGGHSRAFSRKFVWKTIAEKDLELLETFRKIG